MKIWTGYATFLMYINAQTGSNEKKKNGGINMAMKFLKEEAFLVLNKEDYKETLTEIDNATSWQKVYFKDVQVIGIDNIPILLDEVKEKHEMTALDENVIVSCMENSGICVQFPENNKMKTYPVSTIGYQGVVLRAGFSGPALNYGESSKRNPMPPIERAKVLNAGLSTYKDSESAFGYIMRRYDRIDAFHSSEYSVLPVSELLEVVEDVLDFYYEGWDFQDGSVSPSFVSLKWQIKDTNLETELKKIFKKEDFKICLVMLSSDTGTSSAKLYLALQGKSSFPILVGRPKGVPHKCGKTTADFSAAANAITASIRDNFSLIQELTKKKCVHVGGAIRLLAYKFRLPKKISLQVAEEYAIGYPTGATFYEVFIALQDIIYQYQKDTDKVTPEKSFELSEAVVDMLYMERIEETDRNFDWNE